MATASPTPIGQGSHFTSLGRRTSARQALRRPPSRSQMAPSVTTSTASKRASSTAADAQQYSTLHDSSDDEMPIPMKLSALTKALLNDGASAPDDGVAAAAAAEAVPTVSGPATRRRSALTRSTSSNAAAEADVSNANLERPGVRQTRARHLRAGSAQPMTSGTSVAGGAPSSASRPTSPLLRSHDNSPAPRKRVVRLSTTTPAAGSMAATAPPPALRRPLSASKHSGSRRGVPASLATAPAATTVAISTADRADNGGAAASMDGVVTSSGVATEAVNTPASNMRRVQIAVGSSGSRSGGARSAHRSSVRLSASSALGLRSSMRLGDGASDSKPNHEPVVPDEAPSTVGRPTTAHPLGSALRSYGSSTAIGGSGSSSSAGTIGRSGSRDGDAQQGGGLQGASSIRIKRVGKVLGGGFLSGPARRGRRHTSDEDGGGTGVDANSPDENMASEQAHDHLENRAAPGHGSTSRSAYYAYSRGDEYPAATGSPVGGKMASGQRAGTLRGRGSGADLLVRDEQQETSVPPVQSVVHDRQPFRVQADTVDEANKAVAKASNVLSTRPHLPSANDQENEAPYMGGGRGTADKPVVVSAFADEKAHAALRPVDIKIPSAATAAVSSKGALAPASSVAAAAATSGTEAATQSPERKALGAISRNTPHRPAPRPPPPPPKMTMLETATAATAGAAGTAQANKKPRILLKVNGRSYQRVDCIGRGGSAKVYKVTAENGKMFAMKRVSLENADEGTVRGCLGEIELLKKLSGVDRVIQLFDYEMNKEKQMLSLLMELGEMDLNSLLRVRQNPESARLDPVFVRFYWKEMLECLQAVHAHDIVHSDLKPANFVVVQGRLKLIDFGIANAIQTEMTVNVHRETQIGTPNYMSPESLMDAQQYAFTANTNSANGRLFGAVPPAKGAPRLVKLGKPSDVWSLGCILYQMVYGLPPFGHIQNHMARCQAIITWSHAIDFPTRGLGGASVPPALLATMKRCLNREQQLRPTCADMLASTDAFLYPEVQLAPAIAGADGTLPITEELLGRIIQSVVTRCRERMPSDNETLAAWPTAYWASVRRAVAAREERQQQ